MEKRGYRNIAFWVADTYLCDEIFLKDSNYNRDDCLAAFRELKSVFNKNGWDCHTQDYYLMCGVVPDVILSFDVINAPLKYVDSLPDAKKPTMYLVLLECEGIKPANWDKKKHKAFKRVFTWHRPDVDGEKYIELFGWPTDINVQISTKKEKKLCVMIASNKKNFRKNMLYKDRERVLNWFEKNHPDKFGLCQRI